MNADPRVALPTEYPTLEKALRDGLAQVETTLHAAVKSDYPFVTETSTHLVDAGGKRFRPLLVLLAAQFGDAAAAHVVPAAAVVELTHLATLYHDDVMDEAALRRGAASANARWDNSVAILTGDFLFARAADLAADLGPDAVRLLARTFERLVTGQIRETVGPEGGTDPVEHYLSVLTEKTASLISISARFGAMFAGAGDQVVDVVARFGERYGVAFQLSDDLLDVLSESTDSGKTPGTDLREGVPTLPILLTRRDARPEDARLLALLDSGLGSDDDHAEALQLLRAHPAMVAARAEVVRWAEAARDVLAPLPDVPAKHAMAALCEQLVGRTG